VRAQRHRAWRTWGRGSVEAARGSVLVAVLVVAVLVAAVLPPPGVVLALFTSSVPAGGNTATANSCLAAETKTIQKGTATSTGDGTTTVAISAVDTTKAFLIFNLSTNSNRPVGSVIRGRLASATSLEFIRSTDETSMITIQWYVVEYTCGVKVQPGDVTVDSVPKDVTITAVSSLSSAYVTWSGNVAAADQSWDMNDPYVGELTSTTNLEFRTGTIVGGLHTVSWQVIEFTSSRFGWVQKGTTSLTGGALSTTVTLSTGVDTTKAFVLTGLRSINGSGADIGDRMIRTRLTNSTMLIIDRAVAGDDDIDEISWQVIEFKQRVRVQQGNASFGSGTATVNASLSPVDTNATIALASTQDSSGQGSGRTSYVGDDILGVGQATLAVSATQLTLIRANTAAAADIAWFVIEFDVGCARAKSVQQGSFTNTSNGLTTVSISSVDTTKAFLLYTLRSNSDRPVASALKGRLATATTLEFSRTTDEGSPSPIDVQWSVVEYTCGVKVQRGSASADANVDVAITPVVSLSQAFVTCSKSTDLNYVGQWDMNDAFLCDLTNTGNLQVRMGSGASGNDSSTLYWQVVEFTSSEFANVQKGSTSLTGTALSTSVTLPAAVDPTRTFVLVGINNGNSDGNANIGDRLVRAQVTNSTTVTIDRSTSGDDLTELFWQVVELKDGTVVQSGSTNLATGAATATATLTWVRTARTIAFASTQSAGGQETGRTSYNGDDIPGVAQATLVVTTPTQLTLTRSNTAAPADIAWFVVEFPSP
jgi:hypothetical protein